MAIPLAAILAIAVAKAAASAHASMQKAQQASKLPKSNASPPRDIAMPSSTPPAGTQAGLGSMMPMPMASDNQNPQSMNDLMATLMGGAQQKPQQPSLLDMLRQYGGRGF